jgi:prepilin-type processing-associated H-X9-DG protein
MEQTPYTSKKSFRTFVQDSELTAAGPSRLWVFIDENEATVDDGWFLVTMDDSRPFASQPATRHSQGYDLAFADGHVERSKLLDPASQRFGSEGGQFSPFNGDWLRLKDKTTIP